MSEKLIPVRIVIREDQRAFLDEHEEINISGFVRISLDQLMKRYRSNETRCALCSDCVGVDGKQEPAQPDPEEP